MPTTPAHPAPPAQPAEPAYGGPPRQAAPVQDATFYDAEPLGPLDLLGGDYQAGSYDLDPSYQPADAPPGQYPPAGHPAAGPTSGHANRWLLVCALVLGAFLIGMIGYWALRPASAPGGAGRSTTASAPAAAAPLQAGGYTFTPVADRTDTDCAGHAYGKVVDFFRTTPCASLHRRVFTTTTDDGQAAVVSVSMVRMPGDGDATKLLALTDADGTGDVADLFREGVTVPGKPDGLTASGYASARTGPTAVIAESDFDDPGHQDRARLTRLATAAASLPPS